MGKRRKKRNKAKKKEKVMFEGFKKKIGFGVNSVTLPSDTDKEMTTLSIPLFTQKALNTIRDIGMPAAGGAEYQVHYRGLQIIVETKDVEQDPRRLVFTIPTVFFNFPQTVTTVSVDFILNEVAEISEKMIPISDALIEKYLAAFPSKYFEDQGYIVSARELEMGSIHRHPSAFGFSGTDLDNRADNPGVIFRNLECSDKVQVDSVMYMASRTSDVRLVTTETRVVDVAPAEDGGIEGSYAKAPTLTYIVKEQEPQIGFDSFFGEVEPESQDIEFTINRDELPVSENYPKLEEILKTFVKDVNYDPQVIMSADFIKSRGYSAGTYTYSRSGSYYGKPGAGKTTGIYDLYDDDYDEYDEHTVVVKPIDTTTVSYGNSKAQTGIYRPSYKKNQTISALKLKNIDVDNIPEIDGSATDEDIFAIMSTMKEAKYTDAQIRAFFSQMRYPADAVEKYYRMLSTENAETKADLIPLKGD